MPSPDLMPEVQLSPLPALVAADSLPHRSYERAQCVLFCGRREFGKTTTLKRYIQCCEPRVCALDPFEDLDAMMRAYTLDELFGDLDPGGPCRRRYVPSIRMKPDKLEAFGEVFFDRCWEDLRNSLLLLDEIRLWTGPRSTSTLRALINQGRRLGIRVAAAAQQVSQVPDVFLSECTQLVIFRTTRPADLDTLRDWGGKDVAKSATKLNQGECLVLDL